MARRITYIVPINYILSDKWQTTDMQPLIFSSMDAFAITSLSQLGLYVQQQCCKTFIIIMHVLHAHKRIVHRIAISM
jgi:hypothetical protein